MAKTARCRSEPEVNSGYRNIASKAAGNYNSVSVWEFRSTVQYSTMLYCHLNFLTDRNFCIIKENTSSATAASKTSLYIWKLIRDNLVSEPLNADLCALLFGETYLRFGEYICVHVSAWVEINFYKIVHCMFLHHKYLLNFHKVFILLGNSWSFAKCQQTYIIAP